MRVKAISSSWKVVAVGGVLAAIIAAHHATGPAHVWWHVAYQDLCYLPILVSAYWFGPAGGVAAALVAGAGTFRHFEGLWHDNPAFIISEYGQALGFLIAGAVGGALASAERRATRHYQQALAAIAAAHDELRKSHDEVRRADRLSSLGEIAAGLAHEIGNPLGGIKGSLEIIAGRALPGSPEAEFSAIGTREIARIERLIEEFLRYAKPHAPLRRDVDIFEVVLRVVTLLRPQAEEHGVSVEVQQNSTPPVSIDAEQVTQVFVNIVLNAIQISPRGGRIAIGAHVEDDRLVVAVRDQGPGIRPDDLRRVFEPFFSTRRRGTGLGLAVSQRIVQAHEGQIEIRQPGNGTIVRVLLPLQTGQPAETV
jgi:signal transduction histidine kinase